ncbi:hypothetical protein DFH09DRAFT_1088937 [Mycena vulgaris]|nr:hypothetical protein DFH09DRAFT_1088937 [Mycena vulgaris]
MCGPEEPDVALLPSDYQSQSQASKPGLEWVHAIPYSELPCSAEMMQVITHPFCGAPPANPSARNNFSQSGQPLLDDKIELSMSGLRAKPDQARIAGPGSGFKNSKPEPDQAKPKPWFPGQAKPAKH